MRMLTAAELDALMVECFADQLQTADDIRRAAQQLVARAEFHGLVLTIAQHSIEPLAIGNYVTEVHVREARR